MNPESNRFQPISKLIYNAVFVVIPIIITLLFGMFSSQLNHSILEREIWQTQRAASFISKIANQEIGRCLSILDTTALSLPLLGEDLELVVSITKAQALFFLTARTQAWL